MPFFRLLVAAAALSVGLSTAAQAVPLAFTSDQIVYDRVGFGCTGFSFCDRPDLTLGLRLSSIIDLPDLLSDFRGEVNVTGLSYSLTETLPILSQPSPGRPPSVSVEYTAPTPGNSASLEIYDFVYINGMVYNEPRLSVETTATIDGFVYRAGAADFILNFNIFRSKTSVLATLGSVPEVAAIPVPLALLGSALGCMGLLRLRRRKG